MAKIVEWLNALSGTVGNGLLAVWERLLKTRWGEHGGALLTDEQEEVARIVSQGSVRDEGEYHLVRYWLGEIEGQPARKQEADVLRGMLNAYQGPRDGRPLRGQGLQGRSHRR